MNPCRSAILGAALALLWCPEPRAAADQVPPVRASLICEQNAVVPGQTFTVALRLRMAPGYHTYWRNAGTIGLPTSIRWTLPAGFKAGPIQWPRPQIHQMADYRVWGYQNESLLLVDITPPPDLPLGQQTKLIADASWMACKNLCHPGFRQLVLTLPVAERRSLHPTRNTQFNRVRRQQPVALPEWQLSCVRNGANYRLSIVSARPIPQADIRSGAIEFFGFDRQISSALPQTIRRLPNGWELTLRQEEFTPERTDRLTGILVSERGWKTEEPQRPLLVDIPIETSSATDR